MSDLETRFWKVVAGVSIDLPLMRVEQLARHVQAADGPIDLTEALVGQPELSIVELNRAWQRYPVDGRVLAGGLRAAVHTALSMRASEEMELVWTGPVTPVVPVRHTERVLLEVIESAERSLFLVSFVAYEVASVVNAVREAIARGVNVSLLLETHTSHGGRLSVDSIAKMRAALPSAFFYVWTVKGRTTRGLGGAVHAKCAVADHLRCFVTSANLTGAALELNMELGILVRGGELPRRLHDHLHALITTRVITLA